MISMGKKLRAWSFSGSFPDKSPIRFGTAYLPFDAKAHEVEAELRRVWAECFPIDPPANAVAVPGMVLFVPEDEPNSGEAD